MKFAPVFLIFLLIFLFLNSPVKAIVNPLDQPNNRVGIHITDESDLVRAAELVNSSGGDWGYVTIVMSETDRNYDKWAHLFNRMRDLHLIPIIRLATQTENGVWVVPQKHHIAEWVGFLNSLPWVIQNRYIVLFNEPNHAKEWGGSINPEEYVDIASLFAKYLNHASPNFFILPAAMDAAAPTGKVTMNSYDFLSRMYKHRPDFFTMIDGWNSHAYPNPGFSGSPLNSGKATVYGYQWEQELLKTFGVTRDLPVFITETGWIHRDGLRTNNNYLTSTQIGSYLVQSFSSAWNQDTIIAVTPFILSYHQTPFDHFSWFKPGTEEPLPHYLAVQAMPKTAGSPIQIRESTYTSSFLPTELLTESDYIVKVQFENTGQTVWNPGEYILRVAGSVPKGTLWIGKVPKTYPLNTAEIWLKFETPSIPGNYTLSLQLEHQGKTFGQHVSHNIQVSKKTDVLARFRLWLQLMLHPQQFSGLGV